jgi:hypothetical protein
MLEQALYALLYISLSTIPVVFLFFGRACMSILKGAGFDVGPICDSSDNPVSWQYFIAV